MRTLGVMKRLAACGLALLVGPAIANHASSAQTLHPDFIEAPCDLPRISPDIRPRLRCGTVSVPRDHGHPDARRFRLAVVVVSSKRQPALPDPLVYISGGPGSPLTVHAAYQAEHPFAPDRDLILVDQRGTGRSEPRICPNHEAGLVVALAKAVIEPTAEMRAARRAAFTGCRNEAIASGIDLGNFGTAVTIQDFAAVRRALGVAEWNVFGVSYGTTVAMTMMARTPETIRSAVLDSVYPPDPIPPLWSVRVAGARDAFLAACDRDTACAAVYPNLGQTYRETMTRLDRSPPALSLPPELRDPSRPGRLTASLFEFVVGQLVYFPSFYPDLPRLIASVHDGDTTHFARALATLFAEASDPETGTNLAAGAAVECRDRPRLRQNRADAAEALDRTSLYDVCDDWGELGSPPVIPVGTGVPTLVLAGQFDPNIRPDDSRHVANLMRPHARWLEFPWAGHSVRAFSPCAARIVAAFVDQPARAALDTSCASHPPAIQFSPR